MPFAFLTGGLSMIGEGITRQLVARGWTLAVTDLDLADKVAAAAAGPLPVEAFMLDATKGAEAKELVHSLLARHGAIDGLVNAAGGMRGLGLPKADFADLTPEVWTASRRQFPQRTSLHPRRAAPPWSQPSVARSSVSRRAAACTAGRKGRYILPPKPQSSRSVNRLLRKSAGPAFGSTQSHPATPRRAGKSTSLCAVRSAARRPAMMSGGRSPSCSLTTPTTSPAAASTFSGGSTLH
jgi:Enoyl-(Acyl carrier protein) reductase